MERHRLKNVIILILVFLNLFLLASLLTQRIADQSAQRAAAEELSALFAADGMQLDPGVISRDIPPNSQNVVRDATMESQVAALILGVTVSPVDQGGGITTYSESGNSVQFRSGGNFDTNLVNPISDGSHFCSSFCKSFSYGPPQFNLDESGSGTAIATQQREHLTIYNSVVTFTLENGSITAISGTIVSENYTPVLESQDMLSAVAALTAFQQSRQETGSVVSAISKMELCWELQNASSNITLAPVWCISTNTTNFYVNCVTGAVRRS